METITRMGKGGRVVLPAELRRALGLSEGDEVILRLTDQELHLITPRQAVKKAQALVRRYVPDSVRLVDELIAERRREAAGE
ncbi:MAG: AbrB/MazE/SpoVT family DNA-binding domain-containing protein [Gammaproteobacteria bacterium]